jgi:uncharacterized protein YjbJ (UPF0337 family)
MNRDQVEGKWKQVKGTLREKWGKFTDDDVNVIAGNRDKLVGLLQERYGMAREEAQREADQWYRAEFETDVTEPATRNRL